MDTYKRIIAKEIAQMTEVQEGFDEGSPEWEAYEDMLDAIVMLLSTTGTRKAE